MGVTFLTPTAALVAVAVTAPLAALLLAERRAARARRLLRLPEPPLRSRLPVPLALCAVAALVAVAAAQPVVRERHPRYARTDAEALFAIDVSRSMLASRSPGAATRVARAKAIARRLRAGLSDIPAGIMAFTDRALPHLFPSSSLDSFATTLDRAVGIERPPPRGVGLTATTFDAIADAPRLYFSPDAHRRLLVVLTDGESRDFDVGGLRRSFGSVRGLSTIVVQVRRRDEAVFGPGGLVEAGYRLGAGDPGAVASLAAAAGARVFGEGEAGAAARAARAALGEGPRVPAAATPSTTELAPFLVLGALAPLALLLGRRNL